MICLAACWACGSATGREEARVAPIANDIPDSVRVPYTEARRMVANYAPNGNTRAVWFDIQLLQSLVHEAATAGADGVRFYLATYTNGGNNTLLLVPTRDSVANEQTFHRDDFSIWASGGTGVSATSASEGDGSVNRGGLIPPDTTDGALLLD